MEGRARGLGDDDFEVVVVAIGDDEVVRVVLDTSAAVSIRVHVNDRQRVDVLAQLREGGQRHC